MCGIFGGINHEAVSPVILAGLHRLEYRGYDSAGIAVLHDGAIATRRACGKLVALEEALAKQPLQGAIGIGHTRWATHGQPTETNAHPHVCGPVAVVHNGIIENYKELKQRLITQGHRFASQTDSEVVPHLIHQLLRNGMAPLDAVRAALAQLHGAYALGIMIEGEQDQLFAARRGSPLVIGEGDDGIYLASDAIALADAAQHITYLDNDDIVAIDSHGPRFYGANGQVVARMRKALQTAQACADKQGYAHYMLKEIHEQPRVVQETLKAATPEMFADVDFKRMARLHIVACGTSYYAGMVAKYWFEKYAKLPVSVDIASEFRYREAPLARGDAALFISQSGETADTLAALAYARQCGVQIISLVNVPGSSIAREADAVFYTQAGPEIGVASTKAFTTQLTLLARMAAYAGGERGYISEKQAAEIAAQLSQASQAIKNVLKFAGTLEDMAEAICHAKSVLYLGRGAMYPIALEGALKLKEISYIHAEGYAAGELKHGPIALVDSDTPVIMLVPDDELLEKTASNMQEVAARGGKVLLIGGEEAERALSEHAHMTLTLFRVESAIAPLVYVVALQLLAYYVAVLNHRDVDQPRNLAKSVTVE